MDVRERLSERRIDSDSITRRRVLALGASGVAGAGGLSVFGTADTRAAVSVEEFSVSDATFEAAQVTPILNATVGYAYSVATVSELWIGLLVGDTVVAEESLRTGTAELERTTDLSGRVLDADTYSQSDFAVERGETATVTVECGVRFEVRDGDNVVASDETRDSATVEVVSPMDETYATVGGSAEIVSGG
jgi:hypothetical protein